MLLDLLPELVKSDEVIDEVYDLYQFMIDNWCAREERWIAKHNLINVSKQFAVFLYLEQSSGNGDRITVATMNRISEEVLENNPEWKFLTTRSLLNRDGDGKFNFAHRSIMEFFFVLAAIEGEQRCFNVKWTGFMRELLISWGHAKCSDGDQVVAERILNTDLSRTGLSPLSELPPTPSLVSSRSFDEAAQRRTQNGTGPRTASGLWRRHSVTLQTKANFHYLLDKEFNLKWRIPDPAQWRDEQLAPLYRQPLARIARDAQRDSEFRLPSYAEFLALLEGLNAIDEEALIERNTLYPLGDMLGKKQPLALVLGDLNMDRQGVEVIDRARRVPGISTRVSVCAYGIHVSTRHTSSVSGIAAHVCYGL